MVAVGEKFCNKNKLVSPWIRAFVDISTEMKSIFFNNTFMTRQTVKVRGTTNCIISTPYQKNDVYLILLKLEKFSNIETTKRDCKGKMKGGLG